MKKLITGAVAALALLFGFASCSGDLHDDVAPDTMYIIGALQSSTWDKTEEMTTDSTGIYSITTNFAANAEFKLIKVKDKGDSSWSAAQEQWGSDGFSSTGGAKNFALNNASAGKYKVTINIMTNTLTSQDANSIISGTTVPATVTPTIRGDIVNGDWSCTKMTDNKDGSYSYTTTNTDNKGDSIVILLMTDEEISAGTWANVRRYGNADGIVVGTKTALPVIGGYRSDGTTDNNTKVTGLDKSKNYKITVSSDTANVYLLIEEVK